MKKSKVFWSLAIAILAIAGCKDPDAVKKEVQEEAAWKSYIATMSKKGPIIETKLDEEMPIPDHPGYIYQGVFDRDSDGHQIKISAPERSDYYDGPEDRHQFYEDGCQWLTIPQPRPGDDLNAYYGDASTSDCFLSGVLHVTSVSKGAIWYIVDTDALRNMDNFMALNYFVHYQTGTVVGVGGTLPALLKSEISFFADFGKEGSARAHGNTVQIGDATLVLRVKSVEGIYTIEVTSTDEEDRQQSLVGLAAAITNGTTVRFPVDWHVYKQVDLKDIFSESKIGRLDAEHIEVMN